MASADESEETNVWQVCTHMCVWGGVCVHMNDAKSHGVGGQVSEDESVAGVYTCVCVCGCVYLSHQKSHCVSSFVSED